MDWFTVTLQPSAIQPAVLILSALVIINAVRWVTHDRIERRRHPLPPGPTPLPLFGSMLSINAQQPWLTYTAWRAKYGDVMYIRLLDTDLIVSNSYSDTIELLEKRSRIYSDRPFIATLDPYGHGANVGFHQYGPSWRLGRRILHQTFHAGVALAFRPMQLRQARQIIINIVDDPTGYYSHYSTYSSAVAMSAVYDYEPTVRGDPLVKLINDFCEASAPSLTPEMAALLKACPFLLKVPEWIPGLSRIRREAERSFDLGTKVLNAPYQLVQKRMAAKEDIVPNTMVFDHIQRMEKLDGLRRAEYEQVLKGASVAAFLGSSETTSATLMTFTLAMIKNPRVWKRAQADIDAVVGTDRLPEFEDRPFLPYIDAIVRETMRWIPVSPMGLPHAVTSDDIYKGYYIPRGATVLANIWAMTRDESRYPDPEAFIPERFLDPEGALNDDDPASMIFGFGRRKCVGRHVADASVWSGIATLLATLDFNTVKDENGNDIKFETKYVNGLSHHPVSFPCNLVPRAHITKEFLLHSLAK